jgi:phosphoadenosine phosphosulfate reductase
MIDAARLDRHDKIALCVSGGKDSLACVELLRGEFDRITVYHVDTGDLLPEMVASVARIVAQVPHFVRIETDVGRWILDHGLPSDLLPPAQHPIGWLRGESKIRLVLGHECCWFNRMAPLWQRIKDDGNTLLIRGTKRVDQPRLPLEDGEQQDGIELYHPLQEWSNDQVFAFLALHHIPLPRLYDYVVQAPDCARCSAWWIDGRSAYLRRYHPLLWREYDTRLQAVIDEVAPSLALLRREAGVT